MSKLTDNLLRAIDYDVVKNRRTKNYTYLHEHLEKNNRLQLNIVEGAFMYPFYIKNGTDIRKRLQAQKIYVPMLWPDVLKLCVPTDLEYDMASNILPLPVDQRYNENDMRIIVQEVKKCIS